jgi:hypothetical protein
MLRREEHSGPVETTHPSSIKKLKTAIVPYILEEKMRLWSGSDINNLIIEDIQIMAKPLQPSSIKKPEMVIGPADPMDAKTLETAANVQLLVS